MNKSELEVIILNGSLRCKTSHVTLCSKHSKIMKAAGKTKSTNASKSKVGGSKPSGSLKISGFKGDVNKFDQYSNFCCPVKLIKPHQVFRLTYIRLLASRVRKLPIRQITYVIMCNLTRNLLRNK